MRVVHARWDVFLFSYDGDAFVDAHVYDRAFVYMQK